MWLYRLYEDGILLMPESFHALRCIYKMNNPVHLDSLVYVILTLITVSYDSSQNINDRMCDVRNSVVLEQNNSLYFISYTARRYFDSHTTRIC